MEDREVKILRYEPTAGEIMELLKSIPEDTIIAISSVSDRKIDCEKPFAHITAKYYKDYKTLQLVRYVGL